MKDRCFYKGLLCVGMMFLLALFLHPAKAQEGMIRGIVQEKDSPKRVAEATVTNMRTLKKALSSNLGQFGIEARKGDTLLVTKFGYSSSYQQLSNTQDVVLRLNPTIELETVTVTGQTRESQMEGIMDDYRKQGVFNNGKKPKALQYLASPLTALYERFGKTPGNARRFRNYMERELEETDVDKKFNKYNVSEITGLEGDDLVNFMALYRPSFDQARYWNDYDVRSYLKTSLDKFVKDGKPKAETLPRIPIPTQQLNEGEEMK